MELYSLENLTVNGGFSIATFDYQRVYIYKCILYVYIGVCHQPIPFPFFSSELSSFDLTHRVVPWWQICYEWSAFGAISCAQWELLLDRPSMWEHRGPTLRKHSPYTVAHVQTIYLSIDKLESWSDEQCIYIRRWQSLFFVADGA